MGSPPTDSLTMYQLLLTLLASSLVSGQSKLETSVWEGAGIVPDFLAKAPSTKNFRLEWEDSGVTASLNDTMDTADMGTPPFSKWKAPKKGQLYTFMIVDFGVNEGGAQYFHYLVTNVPNNMLAEGDESIEYLAPYGFLRNEANTKLVDTGDAAIHQVAVLVYKQPGPIEVEETTSGCDEGILTVRLINQPEFVAKYGLGNPVAGSLFWTKYTEAVNAYLCLTTKCAGFFFPYKLSGINTGKECEKTVWEAAGVVPAFLPEDPPNKLKVKWDDLTVSTNSTVDTADMETGLPKLNWKTRKGTRYTVMIIDFGVVGENGENYFHLMVNNVPNNKKLADGDESLEYIAPFAFQRNEDNTALVDTGDAAHNPIGVLVFKQPGTLVVDETQAGCNIGMLTSRMLNVADLVAKYGLEGPTYGNLFWSKYSPETSNDYLCRYSKCTGFPFPYPLPGINDAPECQPPTVWEAAGIVPNFLAQEPPSDDILVKWKKSGVVAELNATLATGDMESIPKLNFKTKKNHRYTIMIVDFGVPYFHWMVNNVPASLKIENGDESLEYITPFAFSENEDATALIDTGDAAHNPIAVLVYEQPGTIVVEETQAGCNPDLLNARVLNPADLVAKYNLGDPIQGTFFWSKYTAGVSDDYLCYYTQCAGFPFPFPVPGINDIEECGAIFKQ